MVLDSREADLEQRERDFLADLKLLFEKRIIPADEIDNIINELRTKEVKTYLEALKIGTKPEDALKYAFFGADSIFNRLFGKLMPEVSLVAGEGWVDYTIDLGTGKPVLLELKSLFIAEIEEIHGKKHLKKLKQVELRWKTHKDQIIKYARGSGVKAKEYIILSNLREWFFFSRDVRERKCEPFYETDIFSLLNESKIVRSLWDYLQRKESEAIKFELGKEFFESLKLWVKKLSEIKFKVEEKKKIELVIGLINKFIFIQTLDDYGVIDYRWIQNTWLEKERRWAPKGKLKVLEEFFKDVDEWFYAYYDTELFKWNILDCIDKSEENIELFYRNLMLVLGLAYWQTALGGFKGIIQYKFRYIDEDIFGKAYETFFGRRKEEGIYYTPKYVTEYIVENTIGKVLDDLVAKIRESVEKEDFEKARQLIEKLISIRVLDPACGSGSFLIKAIRSIFRRYKEVEEILNKNSKIKSDKITAFNSSKLTYCSELKSLLGFGSNRKVISKILLRHIHGNDLDRRAIEVAKVNLWLEAIKLSPEDFRYDRLPKETSHILPNLGTNFGCGDSLVGLPEDLTIEYLESKHKEKIVKLFKLRRKYLEDPTKTELVDQIKQIKDALRNDINELFKGYLEERKLPLRIVEKTKPFHWALDFWYLYFNENGEPLPDNQRGVDVVVGNPPYERIQILNKKAPLYVQYLNNAGFESAFKNYDLAVIFIERGFKLLKRGGEFGYIVTQKFMQADYGERLRNFLSKGKFVTQIINFGDQQVFEEATTYTILLFLKNSENKVFKYCRIRKLEETIDQLMKVKKYDSLNEESLVIYTITSNRLTSETWIFPSPLEESIITKLEFLPKFIKFRDKIFQGITTSADKVFILKLRGYRDSLIKVYSKSQSKDYELEKDILKPILMGKDVRKWLTREPSNVVLFPYRIKGSKAQLISEEELRLKYPRAWKYLLDNKQLLESRERGRKRGKPDWYGYIYRKNLEKYEQPKILTQVLSSRASLALDEIGKYYFVGGGNAGVYGVLLKKQCGLSLKFSCALLNSSLLDWYLKKVSTPFRGGFYSYARRFLERLPIKLPETKREKVMAEAIEELVGRICNLKGARYTLFNTWREWSIKLKNNQRSLLEILTRDKERMQAGKFEECWISRVPFFPKVDQEIMKKSFFKFKIRGDLEIVSLKIYGVNEKNEEELVYEIEFNNRDLMLHVYLSILALLESRSKVNSLLDLLKKTSIPVIKPNIAKNTVNILKKVREEFEKWLREKKLEDIEPDIVKIDNEIENLEARIDAMVFKLYGLDESEMQVVFDFLKTPTTYRKKVFNEFKKLKDDKYA